MLILKRETLVFGILAIVVFSFFVNETAYAKKYTRSCSASYSVCPAGGGNCWTFNFTGKGTIGYFNPNKARKRARRNIDQCIDAHWAKYTATGRPQECTNANQVYNYPVGSLVVEMSQNICRRNPGRSSVIVSIYATYRGDSGCTLDNNSWNRNIARNHTVHCPGEDVLH